MWAYVGPTAMTLAEMEMVLCACHLEKSIPPSGAYYQGTCLVAQPLCSRNLSHTSPVEPLNIAKDLDSGGLLPEKLASDRWEIQYKKGPLSMGSILKTHGQSKGNKSMICKNLNFLASTSPRDHL